jgi:hypothetical protein
VSEPKRWRVSYKAGITLDTGEPCFDPGVSAPMVLAVEYDNIVAERDGFRDSFNRQCEVNIDLCKERDELRKQVLRIGNFDVYEFSGGLAIRDTDGLVTAMHPKRWIELGKDG